MKRLGVFTLMMTIALALHAQEEQTRAMTTATSDTTLHLPTLNQYGQMRYVSRWPLYYMGWHSWDLHQGLNISLGANVFTSFGKSWKGTGFGQNVSGMYALPLSDKLSVAVGGYFHNILWSNYTTRDAGLNAVLSYHFNDRWEGYLYGQKSLLSNHVPMPIYDHDIGDRIGAAIKYNFSPSFSVQLNLEYESYRTAQPPFRPQDGQKHATPPL